MRKVFTLFIGLFAVLSVGAQNFVFQYRGQNLADGETINITAEEDVFGDLSCETNNPLAPAEGLVLKLLNNSTATASATLSISSNTLNANMLQWCMGGECTPFSNQTSLSKRITVNNGSELVQFEAIGIQSEGVLKATLQVVIGLESHKVNIVFVNGDATSIETLQTIHRQDPVFYDFNGRRQQGRLLPGLYVVTDGERVRKVMVK